MPEVSIIVPTYNSEKYTQNLDKSINNQTFKNFEVIIIDNYSSDNTVNKLKKLNTSRSNYKFYKIKNKGSIAKSRNFGIEKSKGKYVAFHDSDDFWFPQKLEICLNAIKEYDFIYHDLKINNMNNIFDRRRLYSYQLSKINSFTDIMIKANPISTSSVVCKKEIFNDLKFSEEERLITVEDYDCWINIALKNYKFKYINKILGNYNIYSNNTSKIFQKNSYKYLYIYNRFKKFLPNKEKKILSKNNFRYLTANSLNNKKLKRKYYYHLFFSKIFKSKVKILLKLVFY